MVIPCRLGQQRTLPQAAPQRQLAIMITFQPIRLDNINIAFGLHVREDQTGFVADNTRSIAQAYVWPETYPELIVADDTPVGFMLSATDTSVAGRAWIIRFMIAADHQGHGHGRQALRAALDRFRAQGVREVRLSYEPHNAVARRLYAQEGFVETGEVDDGETVAACVLTPGPARELPALTVEAVDATTRPIFDNLFVAYFNELAAYDPGLLINAYGLPVWKDFTGPTPTNAAECVRFNWWIRDACELHLFRVAGIPAGFAVSLHEPARLPAGIDHEVVDFYILPKFRGHGYGQAAARKLLNRPGHWQLYTLHANRAAQAFWRDTLRSVAGGYTEPQPGLEFRFEVQPIAAD
jgi:diamine N-acetyltransferase